MKIVRQTVDLNAHILIQKKEVVVNNGIPHLSLQIKNLTTSNVIGIKLSAQGFNAFGDLVQINGLSEFQLIIQDINIIPGKFEVCHLIKIPDDRIRKIILIENQIVFSNGEVVSYLGNDDVSIEINTLEESNALELAKLQILRKYEPSSICFPEEIEKGWICICGNFNKQDSEKCLNCNKEKEFLLNNCSEAAINLLLEKKRIELEESEKNKEIRTKKNFKILILFSSIIAVTFMLIIGLIYLRNQKELLNRVTFSSSDEMKEYLKGSWVCSENKALFWFFDYGVDEYSKSENYYIKNTHAGQNVIFDSEKGEVVILDNKDDKNIMILTKDNDDSVSLKNNSIDCYKSPTNSVPPIFMTQEPIFSNNDSSNIIPLDINSPYSFQSSENDCNITSNGVTYLIQEVDSSRDVSKISITLQNDQGGIEQGEFSLPFCRDFSNFFRGDFLYISAQIIQPTQNAGQITCKIYQDNELISQATANDFPSIASCSGLAE